MAWRSISRHHALLSRRGPTEQERGRRRRDEGVVIDIGLDPLDASLRGLPDGLLQRLEQCGVGFRVVEGLAWRTRGRTLRPPAGEARTGTLHLVDARPDPCANDAVLLLRCAHQRHTRIVNDEPASAELFQAQCRAARN